MSNGSRRPLSGDDYTHINSLNNGNILAINDISNDTVKLLENAKELGENLDRDLSLLSELDDKMNESINYVKKGVNYVNSVLEDESGIGIIKMGFLIFVALCIIYFGGKMIILLFR